MPCDGAQVAAELDGRLDLGRALSDDEQSNLAVLQVEALADRDVGGQIAIGRADASRVPAHRLGGDDETRAALEPNGREAVGERPRAHLRARQILQERGVNAELGGDRARGRRSPGRALRAFRARSSNADVGAGNEERAQELPDRARRGRPLRRSSCVSAESIPSAPCLVRRWRQAPALD